MSRTIEQKVVEMRFDNSNFEKNVSKSMDSLNQLKETIDKTSSGNAFTGLSKALDHINFGSITTAIQSVTEKFSLWEEVAIGAARNVGAALSNYVAKGLDSMVFKNIFSGWDKYATKTEAVQTIMASIADQDFGNVSKMEYVEGIMDRLTWFTDETSFHLTDMISSIGKFTSAGVGLDTAADAMMGIANWAAVSGANAETASRVMYQLSQSLGMGAVRTQDWMSVETANMATKEFKELAIAVGKAHGTINDKGIVGSGKTAVKVSYQNFRETLKNNWLTSEVLTDTLGQYSGFAKVINNVYTAFDDAKKFRTTSEVLEIFKELQEQSKTTGKSLEKLFKEKYDLDVDFSKYDQTGKKIGSLTDDITELGMRAFMAAQEAKTFKEAIDSVGEGAASVWMNIFETVFGNYEQAKVLWTDLANKLYTLFVDPIYLISDAFGEWAELDGRELLFGIDEASGVATGAFTIILESLTTLSETFWGVFHDMFPFGGKQLISISKKLLNFAYRVQMTDEKVEKMRKKFADFFGTAQNVIKFFKEFIDQTKIFSSLWQTAKDIVDKVELSFESTFSGESVIGQFVGILYDLRNGVIRFINALDLSQGPLNTIMLIFQKAGKTATDFNNAIKPIKAFLSGELKSGGIENVAKFLSGKFLNSLLEIPNNILRIINNFDLLGRTSSFIINALKGIKEGFTSTFDKSIFVEIGNSLKYIWNAIELFLGEFKIGENAMKGFKAVARAFAATINLIGNVLNLLLQPLRAMTDHGVFAAIGKFLSGTFLKVLISIPEAIGNIITKINDYIKNHGEVVQVAFDISTIFAKIIKFAIDAASAIGGFITKSKPMSKIGTVIKNILNAFKQSKVIEKFGDMVSNAYAKTLSFFGEGFGFDSFKKKIKEAYASVSEFIKKSDFLSKIRDKLIPFGNVIKQLFTKDADMSGLGAKFDEIASKVSTFAKNIWKWLTNAGNSVVDFVKNSEFIQNAKKTFEEFFGWISKKVKEWFGPKEEGKKSFFSKVSEFFKGLFGKKEAEGDVNGAKTAIESFGEKIGTVFGAVWTAVKWVADKVEKAFDGIKKLWEKLNITGFFDDLIERIKKIFGLFSKKTEPVERTSNVLAASMAGVGDATGGFITKALGVLGVAIPTVLAVKLVDGIRSIMTPFQMLKELVETYKKDAMAGRIIEGIKALGESISSIAKAVGLFLLEIAGAVLVFAVADKITNGNLNVLLISVAGFIAEIMGAIVLVLRQISGYKRLSGNYKDGVADAGYTSNSIADTVQSLADVFKEIGEALLMFAGAVAVISILSKVCGPNAVNQAMSVITIFMLELSLMALMISKFTDDQNKTFGTIDKTGLAIEHSGYADGLYSIGKFMKSMGTAMLLLAGAATLIIAASGGNVDVMQAAFNGMQALLTITMGALVVIIAMSNKMPSGNMKGASDSIKAAGLALVGIGAALRIIAKTVIMLAKEKDADLDKGLLIIGKIGLGILAFAIVAMYAKDTSKFGSVGLLAIEMAAAAVVMAFALKKITEMKADEVNAAVNVLGAFTAMIAVVGALAIIASGAIDTKTKFAEIGFMLLEISAAFVVMAYAMKTIGEIENIGQTILGVIAAVAALGLLFVAVSAIVTPRADKVDEILKATLGLLVIAGAISLLMNTIAAVGVTFANNDGALLQGAIALGAVVLALTALGVIAVATSDHLLKFGLGVAAIGAGLALLGVGFAIFVNTLIVLAAEASLIGGALVDAFGGFLDKILALKPKLVDALTMMLEVICEAIIKSSGVIAKLLINTFKEIITVLYENSDEIIRILDALIHKFAPYLSEWLLIVWNTISPALTTMCEWIEARIEQGVMFILHLFGDILIPGGLSLLNDQLIPGIILGLTQILNWVTMAVTTIVSTIILNLTLIRDFIFETINLVVENVKNILNELINGDNGILDIIDRGLFGEHGIMTMLDELINGENGILQIIERALVGEHGVISIVDTFITDLLDMVRNRATDLVDTVLYLIDEAVRGITEGTDRLLTGVEELIVVIANHIVSLKDTIFQAIIDVIEGLATIIETRSGDFWAAVKHLVKAIWNSFWDLFNGSGENSMDNLGSNMMEGLGKGLINHVQNALNKIGEVATSVWDKFKSVLGINSPSKIAAELGGFIDEGLANGIINNSNLPIGSVGEMGNGIIDYLKSLLGGSGVEEISDVFGENMSDSLSNALGGISDTLESDEFAPTITPVLDLSEIQNGADQIPGMLGADGTYGYSLGSNSMSMAKNASYNPYEYYDGTERVSGQEAQIGYWDALQAKMEEIADKFGRARVVLDTGAVVGGLLDPMDKALGQKMAQVGRGVYSPAK